MEKNKKVLIGIVAWMLLILMLTCTRPAHAAVWVDQLQSEMRQRAVLPPQECKTCQISNKGLDHLKLYEGYSPFIYKDVAGYPTICWGHLVVKGEKFQEPMLGSACTAILKKDVAISDRAVNRHAPYKRRQHHHDAITSFFFNVGEGKVVRGRSTIAAIRAAHHDKIPNLLRKWVYAGGKPVRGLVLRRESEARIYQFGH